MFRHAFRLSWPAVHSFLPCSQTAQLGLFPALPERPSGLAAKLTALAEAISFDMVLKQQVRIRVARSL